jgi:hypothetical protein
MNETITSTEVCDHIGCGKPVYSKGMHGYTAYAGKLCFPHYRLVLRRKGRTDGDMEVLTPKARAGIEEMAADLGVPRWVALEVLVEAGRSSIV